MRLKQLCGRGWLCVWVWAVLLAAAGCENGPTKQERAQLPNFPKAYQATVATDRYTLAPPDVVKIHAPLVPEINDKTQQIAPDGTLNLDLLGRVYVAGMTPQQIEDLLTEKSRTFYKDAKARIDVEYKSQLFYVFGEGDNVGAKPFTGRDTLVRVLADAKPTRLAWPERIYVIKPSPDPDKRHVTVINLYDMAQRGDTTANVLLEQDDIVFIPLNPLAAIGVALQNLLFPVQPVFNTASGVRAIAG